MTMGGLLLGTRVPNAKAPTRVTLTPASVTHSPQAQHSAGDGRFCGGPLARFLRSLVCAGAAGVSSGGLEEEERGSTGAMLPRASDGDSGSGWFF